MPSPLVTSTWFSSFQLQGPRPTRKEGEFLILSLEPSILPIHTLFYFDGFHYWVSHFPYLVWLLPTGTTSLLYASQSVIIFYCSRLIKTKCLGTVFNIHSTAMLIWTGYIVYCIMFNVFYLHFFCIKSHITFKTLTTNVNLDLFNEKLFIYSHQT